MTALQLNAMCPFAKDEIKIVERPLQEVMEHAITLEESERRLTEMIHNYYHPDEWTKEEEREAFLYTSKVNAFRLIARKEYAEGKTISCRTPQEMQQFFDSL